jgi:nitrate/nitrite transport system ATP-binding protein
MIAGLNQISRGQIVLDGIPITGPGPDRGIVFQSPSLFPWMTALENVLLGVEQVFPHISKRDRREICGYYLDKVGLGNDLDRNSADLSQGMQQRVAIARAFAIKPKILLLDEPFGMLDSLTRASLQEVLLQVWNQEKITAIMITHDVDESIFLADRVIMMTSGPRARIGDVLPIHLERPRHRRSVLEHPDYYSLRRHLINFLEH